MRTWILPDGSLVKLADIKAARVGAHFFRFNQYYVDLDMRDGSTREDIQFVSKEIADNRRDKIVSLMQEAWAEIDAYDCGYEAGAARARAEGHSAGLQEGRSEGCRWGWGKGYNDGRQSVVSHLQQKREELMFEQRHSKHIPPSRRRYLRNAVDVLTELIQNFDAT